MAALTKFRPQLLAGLLRPTASSVPSQAAFHSSRWLQNEKRSSSDGPRNQYFGRDLEKLVGDLKETVTTYSKAAARRVVVAYEDPEFRAALAKTRDTAAGFAVKTGNVAVRYAMKAKETVGDEYREFVDNVKSVNLHEMQRQVLASPREYFLYGTLAVSPILLPAMSFVSAWQFYPGLATMQLIWSGVLVTYFAGMRFGLSLVDVGFPNKQTAIHCGLPMVFAWGSMLFPASVSYLGAIVGLFSTVYFDHISTVYPETFHALRVFFTLVAIGSLLVGFFASLNLAERVRPQVQTPALN